MKISAHPLTQRFFLTEEHKNILPCGMGNGLTQKTRKTQKSLHVFTRIYTEKISRKGAKGAERYVLLFLCQKSLHTEITEIHRILLRMFCGCLRRLREIITLRTALVKIRAHSWLKKIRVDTRKYVETFLCIPWIPCEPPPHPAWH